MNSRSNTSTKRRGLSALASESAVQSAIKSELRAGQPSPRVAIIGNGAAGICMGVKLSEAGIDTFTIFDKADRPGGTWRDNSYPGAACDIPSHLYSFSFALKSDWERKFAFQPEILDYFEEVADKYGLMSHMRFGCEVTNVAFDESDATWTLTFADGTTEEFDYVVSGLGQLNRPFVPDIDGLETFEGEVMHSARWNNEYDLAGRPVAVIGNGASALQFIPEVAKEAGEVTIFQRSANWIIPKKDAKFSPRTKLLFSRIPGFKRAYRWSIYWQLESIFSILKEGGRASRTVESKITNELKKIVSDDLPKEALIPDYPPGCKRVLISNNYYETLMSKHVKVELDPIKKVEANSVVTENGNSYKVDAILLGTGFRSTEFLAPMDVVGSGGTNLNEVWADGAESYLGVCLSGFPNFFMLYGPNTNLGHNSIIFMIEAQTRYVMRQIAETMSLGVSYLDVTEGAQTKYNTSVQKRGEKTVWASSCSSWYKNEAGKITNNWTSWSAAYWARMRRFKRGDYTSS